MTEAFHCSLHARHMFYSCCSPETIHAWSTDSCTDHVVSFPALRAVLLECLRWTPMLPLNCVEHHLGAVKLGFQPHPHLRQEKSSRARAFVGTASREQCPLRFGGSFCIFVRWSQSFAVTARPVKGGDKNTSHWSSTHHGTTHTQTRKLSHTNATVFENWRQFPASGASLEQASVSLMQHTHTHF